MKTKIKFFALFLFVSLTAHAFDIKKLGIPGQNAPVAAGESSNQAYLDFRKKMSDWIKTNNGKIDWTAFKTKFQAEYDKCYTTETKIGASDKRTEIHCGKGFSSTDACVLGFAECQASRPKECSGHQSMQDLSKGPCPTPP